MNKFDDYLKLYIIVRDDLPAHIVPILVAHTILNANTLYEHKLTYQIWKRDSFRKVVVQADHLKFEKIRSRFECCEGYESCVLNGEVSCLILVPILNNEVPSILKSCKLWNP